VKGSQQEERWVGSLIGGIWAIQLWTLDGEAQLLCCPLGGTCLGVLSLASFCLIQLPLLRRKRASRFWSLWDTLLCLLSDKPCKSFPLLKNTGQVTYRYTHGFTKSRVINILFKQNLNDEGFISNSCVLCIIFSFKNKKVMIIIIKLIVQL